MGSPEWRVLLEGGRGVRVRLREGQERVTCLVPRRWVSPDGSTLCGPRPPTPVPVPRPDDPRRDWWVYNYFMQRGMLVEERGSRRNKKKYRKYSR